MVANGLNRLTIVDVSNPTAPKLVGNYDTGAPEGFTSTICRGITVSGNCAYVANCDNGLTIIDINNIAAPLLAGHYDTGGSAMAATVVGNYIYVAGGSHGLVIWDINDPTFPTLTGHHYTAGFAYGITVSGNYAYLADFTNGLMIIDISNPSAPALASSYDTAGLASGVTVSGNYAYVADDTNGLVIVNISNPSAPALASSYDTAGLASGVTVSGNYAYVADDTNGLVIVNISNPTTPTLVGNYDTAGSAWDVMVSGNYAYVADRNNGLVIVNISNPTTPTLAGNYDTAGYARGVTISGNYAYVADNQNRLVIIDVSNPTTPKLAGSYYTAGYVPSVTVSNNYAYVANIANGLVILHTDASGTGPQDKSLVQVEGKPEVYWLHNGRLYWVTDWNVINDMSGVPGWDSVNALPASEFDPADYPQGPRFITTGAESDGLLIREQGHPEVYLILGSKKRHFTSPEALLWNGYSFDDVIDVSAAIIGMFPSGSDISITQAIINKYNDLGGEATFGAPGGTGEQLGYPDSSGLVCSYVNFQNGAIECFTSGDYAGNAYAILNPFFDKWASMGYGKSVLGYPISDMSDVRTSSFGTPSRYQKFINGTEEGSLEYNLTSGEVFAIHGAIYAKWSAIGYSNSILGLVTSDEREAVSSFKGTTGRVSDFENGHLHWHSSGEHEGVTYATYGELDYLYASMGGTASWLGFPVMDQEERDGHGYCEFEGGYIEWDGSEYKAIKKSGISVDLYFDKITSTGETETHVNQFKTGDTKISCAQTTVNDGNYNVRTYVTCQIDNGPVKYAYYPDYDPTVGVQPNNPLEFTIVKTPLYDGTWDAESKTWVWNIYKMTGNEQGGTYTWEFWYEDSASGEILGKDVESYDDNRQKLLLLMNQFDFYEKYESHGNDLTGDDQNKNYLSQIESDDIWMIKYPWRFSTFEDGYKFGYDANTWYDKKTRAPDGTLYFEAVEDGTFFKKVVSESGPLGETLLKSLIENVLTLSIGSNGLYAEAPFGYNKENNANITYHSDSYAILPEVGGSLPDVNADFIGQYIYLERTHSLKMSQIDDSRVYFSWELPVDEIDTGVVPYIGVRVKLILSGTGIDLAKGWKFGDEIRPIADISAAKMAMNIESEISADNPAVKAEWSATWEEDPHGMFEIVSPHRDFRDDEYVTSIFTDSKYYGLQYENGQPIVRFKLSKLKQNHLLTLAPFGWDSLKREFLWPITYFKGYDDIVVGTTNVEIKSPVEIHLFDSDGMHFGPNIDEIPNVVYYEKNDSKYLSFPINIDRFTLLLKGLDSGTYTMIITRPLLLTRSDGTSVVTILQYEITDVTTHDEDLDYFDFNFEIINDQIKEKVQQGLDVDIAIAEVLETLDMDEDGIPDIQDKELTFTKSKPTLIVPSMSKQTGDDIVFNANLHHLNEKLGGKNISFYLDNIKIGSNVTDGEGNAQINYLIPSNLATEKHNIIAAFEGDDNFGNVNGTGILNTINIAPKITIIAPEDLFVNGQVLVDADIYDANLKNISLTIDDQEVANSLPYIWDTTNFEDGIHFLQIIGVDSLGEQGLDIKLTIVNNNGYNITFLPPITTPDQFNLTIGSVLPIKFTARDNYTDEFIDDDMVNVTILNSTGNIITNFNITNGIQINSDKEQYKVDFNTMDYPESTLGENCVISVTFGCVDNLRGIAIAYFTFEEDFTPPSTITHLHPTAATTYINWTWTNPPDPNFHHTEIYLNNVFQTITSSRHHNATDLAPETSYTISTRTVDTAGNINQTWMNDTATTLPAPDTTIQITISLNSGWNLISAPLNLTTWKLGEEAAVGDPLNITPENSLTSIYKYNTTSGSFEKCTHYAGWGWDPATGSESFTELEPGRGYWAMAENDCDLTFTGTAPSDLNIPLDADWNCIGWYSTSAALLGEEAVVGDPLSVTPENSLSSIYRYNTTSESFEKCTHYAGWGWEHATGSESFIELEPGRGYWVMAENDCVWEHET